MAFPASKLVKWQLLCATVLLAIAGNLRGQEMHFSQYLENPALLNPALTGVANPLRGSITYRDQWRSVTTPYKTFGVSFETRLRNGNWQSVDNFRSMTFKERGVGRLAWGLSVYNDKAGTAGLTTTNGNFNIASFVPISKKSFISVGLQAALVQRKIDSGKLIFPDQYNSATGYDPGNTTGERLSSLNFTYADFGAGLLWSYGQEEKRIASYAQFKANAGFSVYHLNTPKQAFLMNGSSIDMKYVAHADVFYAPANSNVGFAPSFVAQSQGSSLQFIGGMTMRYYLKDNSHYTGLVKRNSIGYGVYGRSLDAMIMSFLYEIREQYFICFSYDVNLSALAPSSSGRGGFEMTLRYTPTAAYLYEKRPKVDLK
jgi:type IX secretion system PorP/SprF family membrane protein